MEDSFDVRSKDHYNFNSPAGQGPSGTAAGDGEEGEDAAPDDDISSIQIAWEVLELSRVIYARQNSPESQKKLAKVKIKLGEVRTTRLSIML